MTTNQYVKLGFLYLAYCWVTAVCIEHSSNETNTAIIVALYFVLTVVQIGLAFIALFKSFAELFDEIL